MQLQPWLLMLCAILMVEAAAVSPSPTARVNNKKVVETRHKIGDLPQAPKRSLTFTYNISVPANVNLQATSPKDLTPTPLDKRQFFNNFQLIENRCIEPAQNAAPIPSNCETLVLYIENHHHPLQLGPLEYVDYTIGHCNYQIVNMDPCNSLDMPSVSATHPFIAGMYNGCVVPYIHDALVSIRNPTIMLGLYGLEVAPPYSPGACPPPYQRSE